MVPESKHRLHKINNGTERGTLHSFNNFAGKPSGPDAAVGDSSPIASIMSSSLKSISYKTFV